MKTTQKISFILFITVCMNLHIHADDLIALRTEKTIEANSPVSTSSEVNNFTYQIDVYSKPDYKPSAFEETHFLGPEITPKWNDFQQKYKIVHEQSVGLSGKTVEIVKPTVYGAVNKINNHLKKSLRKGEIEQSEVVRILDHVLNCSIELYSEPDTSDIEKEIQSAGNIAELVNVFNSIKLIYHTN